MIWRLKYDQIRLDLKHYKLQLQLVITTAIHTDVIRTPVNTSDTVSFNRDQIISKQQRVPTTYLKLTYNWFTYLI